VTQSFVVLGDFCAQITINGFKQLVDIYQISLAQAFQVFQRKLHELYLANFCILMMSEHIVWIEQIF